MRQQPALEMQHKNSSLYNARVKRETDPFILISEYVGRLLWKWGSLQVSFSSPNTSINIETPVGGRTAQTVVALTKGSGEILLKQHVCPTQPQRIQTRTLSHHCMLHPHARCKLPLHIAPSHHDASSHVPPSNHQGLGSAVIAPHRPQVLQHFEGLSIGLVAQCILF